MFLNLAKSIAYCGRFWSCILAFQMLDKSAFPRKVGNKVGFVLE